MNDHYVTGSCAVVLAMHSCKWRRFRILPDALAIKEEAGLELKLASWARQLKVDITDGQCFTCLCNKRPESTLGLGQHITTAVSQVWSSMWHRLHQDLYVTQTAPRNIWEIGKATSMHFHSYDCAWAIDQGSADHCMQEHGTVEQFCMQQLVRSFCELGQAYGQTWAIVRHYVLFAEYIVLFFCSFCTTAASSCSYCWYLIQLIIWRQPAVTDLSCTRKGTDSGWHHPFK